MNFINISQRTYFTYTTATMQHYMVGGNRVYPEGNSTPSTGRCTILILNVTPETERPVHMHTYFCTANWELNISWFAFWIGFNWTYYKSLKSLITSCSATKVPNGGQLHVGLNFVATCANLYLAVYHSAIWKLEDLCFWFRVTFPNLIHNQCFRVSYIREVVNHLYVRSNGQPMNKNQW